MAFYDTMVAALDRLIRDDAKPYFAEADKLAIIKSLQGMAPMASSGVVMETFAGGAAGATHDVAFDIESVALMLNVAAGVPTVVVLTTDFTFSGKTITWVLTQATDTMVCFYVPAKTW